MENNVFEINKQHTPVEELQNLEFHERNGFACRDCGKLFAFQSGRVSHEKRNHPLLVVDDGGDEDRDKYGYYKCQFSCSLVFKTTTIRRR